MLVKRILAVLAVLLMLVGAPPASPPVRAQESLFRLTRVFEANFAYTEALRLSGHCDAWREQRDHLQYVLAVGLVVSTDQGMTAEASLAYQARLEEALARTCTPAANPGPLPQPPRAQDLNLGELNPVQAADRVLAQARVARQRGECEDNRHLLERARILLQQRPANTGLAQRIAEAERERCIPRPAAAPLPPAQACATSFNDQLASGRGTRCHCSGIYPRLATWGSNPYRGDSPICNAAAHAGALGVDGVGDVNFVLVGLTEPMLGTARNGISTSNWDYNFAPAFSFEGAPPGSR